MARENDTIKTFFDLIQPFEGAFAGQTFHYLGRKTNDGLEILRSALIFKPIANREDKKKIEIQEFIGEIFQLSDVGISANDFVRKLEQGILATLEGEERLSRAMNKFNGKAELPSFFLPKPASISRGQRQDRVIRLQSNGISRQGRLDLEKLNWLFRSHSQPYDGLNDVLAEIGLLQQDVQFEIIALPVVYVDATSSVIGQTATLKVRTASNIEKEKISLGYIVSENGANVSRGVVHSDQMNWDSDPQVANVDVGVVELPVPPSSIVHCFANAFGICHHHFWVGDIQAPQNTARAIFSGFDESLEKLTALIMRPNKRGNARNVESAIAWLFWMSGFGVAHLGDTEGFSDAPDILALTPAGDVLVVECTTGGLKNHQKMQNLLDRSAVVKDQLNRSGKSHLRILPMMITTRTAEEVRNDLEEYHKNEIMVATVDDLDSVLLRTLNPPDATESFSRLWSQMTANKRQLEEGKEVVNKAVKEFTEIKKETRRLKNVIKQNK